MSSPSPCDKERPSRLAGRCSCRPPPAVGGCSASRTATSGDLRPRPLAGWCGQGGRSDNRLNARIDAHTFAKSLMRLDCDSTSPPTNTQLCPTRRHGIAPCPRGVQKIWTGSEQACRTSRRWFRWLSRSNEAKFGNYVASLRHIISARKWRRRLSLVPCNHQIMPMANLILFPLPFAFWNLLRFLPCRADESVSAQAIEIAVLNI
jgi:hypothetical protein